MIGSVIIVTGTTIETGPAIESATETTTTEIVDMTTTMRGSLLIEILAIEILEMYATRERHTTVIENGIIGTRETGIYATLAKSVIHEKSETETRGTCVIHETLGTVATSVTEIAGTLTRLDGQMIDDRSHVLMFVLLLDQNGERRYLRYQKQRSSREGE